MEGINDRYNVELEVLTPLAICSGAEKDWVNGIDFVVADDELYKLDLHRLAAEGVDMSRLAACFENKDVGGVKELIGTRLDDVSDFCMTLPRGISLDTGLENPVKSFVKNQLSDRPIVPGSSIKGAVRSILFEFLISADGESGRSIKGAMRSIFLEILTRADRERRLQSEIRSVFGSPVDGTDFMRFVKFSDVEFDGTSLVNTKIFNLRSNDGRNWHGGWKHGRNNTGERFSNTGFNTIYEAVASHSYGIGSLMLSEKMFEPVMHSSAYSALKKRILTVRGDAPSFLFEIINGHTLSYLNKEKAFFERYEADRTELIVSGIESLIRTVNSLQAEGNKSCIFKMSAGSGFHSITGDWQFDDYSINGLDGRGRISRGLLNGQKSSKSRKIAVDGDRLSLMGFVKMSVADDSAVNQFEARRQEELFLRKQQYEGKKAAEESLRLENEERLRQEREMTRRETAYNTAMDEAEKYYLGENSDNSIALSLFMKAESIWPEGTRHKERIAGLQRLLDDEKAGEDRKKADDDARAEFVKAGLSNLDRRNVNDPSKYLINSFKQVLYSVNGWLKKSKREYVPDSEDGYLAATLSRIFHDNSEERSALADFASSYWEKVCQWCGEQRARHIFEEVTQS